LKIINHLVTAPNGGSARSGERRPTSTPTILVYRARGL
jgi:hypothetical protein